MKDPLRLQPEAEQQPDGAERCQRHADLAVTLHPLPDLDLRGAGRVVHQTLVQRLPQGDQRLTLLLERNEQLGGIWIVE